VFAKRFVDSFPHLVRALSILHRYQREIAWRTGLRQLLMFALFIPPMKVIMQSNRDLCFEPVRQCSRIIQAAGDSLREQAMGRLENDGPTLIHASDDHLRITLLDC